MKLKTALKAKKAPVVQAEEYDLNEESAEETALREQGEGVVAELIESMEKKYGEGAVMRASDAVGLNVQRFSIGCYRIDFALGGGLPESRMIEIFGNESAGKTTLLLKAIASFQRKYKNGVCALFDYERTFDPVYAQLLGVNLARLLVFNPDQAEQGADMMNDLLLNKQVPILIGVDSLAAMTPTSTLDVSAEKAEVGVQARLINRLMAKCNTRMKRNLKDPNFPTTTVIFLNQQREKVGVMFGDPTTTPGGVGKNYYCSVRIKLFSSGASKKKISEKIKIGGFEKEILFARVTSFEVIKNKAGGVPFEDGEYRYFIKPYKGYVPFTYDNEDALYELGRFHGLIAVKPKQGFVYRNVTGGKEHLFIANLRKNQATAELLYNEILLALKTYNTGAMPSGADEGEDE